MSHEIDMTNNQANMAYVGKTPWHGLGQQLPQGSGLDQWRIAAGLDWDIEARAVFHTIADAEGREKAQVIEGKKALVRSDTQACLSVMSDRYQIVQPGDVLEFYRDLVEASDQFTLETAGSLFEGRKVWALARSNLELRLMGQDVIKPYLLLATSCDGTMATVGQFTSVRVVCNNTLNLSVNQAQKQAVRIPHSRQFDATQVKRDLGLIDDTFEHFAVNADRLAQTAISKAQAVDYFAQLYQVTDKQGAVTNESHLKRIINECMGLYIDGPGANLRSANGTAWGLVNTVTRFEDHHARARSNNNRFNNAQFGKGATLKSQAFTSALALAA